MLERIEDDADLVSAVTGRDAVVIPVRLSPVDEVEVDAELGLHVGKRAPYRGGPIRLDRICSMRVDIARGMPGITVASRMPFAR